MIGSRICKIIINGSVSAIPRMPDRCLPGNAFPTSWGVALDEWLPGYAPRETRGREGRTRKTTDVRGGPGLI